MAQRFRRRALQAGVPCSSSGTSWFHKHRTGSSTPIVSLNKINSNPNRAKAIWREGA